MTECKEVASVDVDVPPNRNVKVLVHRGGSQASHIVFWVLQDGKFQADGSINPPEDQDNTIIYWSPVPSLYDDGPRRATHYASTMAWNDGQGADFPLDPAKIRMCLTARGVSIDYYTGVGDKDPNTTVTYIYTR